MKRILFIFLLSLIAFPAMSTEQPEFDLIEQHNDFQLRRYAPMIIAQVEVAGDMGDASSSGFRLLADYIFGNNVVAPSTELTSQISQPESVKIDMTAPVSRMASGDNRWLVSFVMPRQWTIDSLPKPTNSQIKIVEVPAHTAAVIEFSGLGRQTSYEKKQAELINWIASKGYELIDEARYAAYNPPWTLPPFRRNEVIIPVSLD
jgi:hypothetical protein